MRSSKVFIVILFLVTVLNSNAQNLEFKYEKYHPEVTTPYYDFASPFQTPDITSDFGKRYYNQSLTSTPDWVYGWHKGVDFAFPQTSKLYPIAGDDELDDWVNLNKIINFTGTVSNPVVTCNDNQIYLLYFPPGVYNFNKQLDFKAERHNNLIIQGAGSDQTAFVFDMSTDDFYWKTGI